MSRPFCEQIPMTREAIVAAAAELETTYDLLKLLNKIKMSELGEKGHPFTMPHLNYFIHPARNKKNYKTFHIPKKSGGVRDISAPKALLKSFLTYTNKLLQAFYEAPECVTGFVPGKSVVDNAERHIGMNYIFNTDLKDFFPSITKSRVWATLKHPPFRFNDTIADAVAGLCCTEVEIDGKKRWVLPQGSPCSPVLTNIVCRNLDRQLLRLAKKYRLRYSRYADDITFSGNRDVFRPEGEFRQELNAVIGSQRFTVNEKKTRLQKKSERREVTGLVVSDRVNVAREYVRDIENLLYIWERYGETDAYAKFLAHHPLKHNLHQRKPNLHSVLLGKLLYLRMVKGPDSEVWRRLQRRFDKLTGHRSATVTATVKYRYTLADFEEKVGGQLLFEFDEQNVLHCGFTLNGKRTPVALSRYARTRAAHILAGNDPEKLAKFKNAYLLIFYEEGCNGFWRIERKRSCVITLIADDNSGDLEKNPEAPEAGDNRLPEGATDGKNTDEILATLIATGFDLKILDEWDKIKSS